MKPMLAETLYSLSSVCLPLIGSIKLDGIRCLNLGEGPVTRTLHKIPNEFIRDIIQTFAPLGSDGEIIIPGSDFSAVQSAVMSKKGCPDFLYTIFDFHAPGNFIERWGRKPELNNERIKYINHITINTYPELNEFEKKAVEAKYEGIILRNPNSPYIYGRSNNLLKYKRFEDHEAVIVGIKLMKETKSEKGKDKLGAFEVVDKNTKVPFSLGTGAGLTKKYREMVYANPDRFIGAVAKYKCWGFGSKGAPRFPSFIGIRSELDL